MTLLEIVQNTDAQKLLEARRRALIAELRELERYMGVESSLRATAKERRSKREPGQ